MFSTLTNCLVNVTLQVTNDKRSLLLGQGINTEHTQWQCHTSHMYRTGSRVHNETIYIHVRNKKSTMIALGKPTWYPRRAKYFSFFVTLEICSVLSIWIPKNTALKMFKISPTWNKLMQSCYCIKCFPRRNLWGCENCMCIKFSNNESTNAYTWRRSTGFQQSNPYKSQDSSTPGKDRHFCS